MSEHDRMFKSGDAVFAVLILIVIILIVWCSYNDQVKDSYFYPTSTNDVDNTAYYNTVMLSEGASGKPKNNGLPGNNGKKPNNDNGNKNRKNTELEIENINARSIFDFQPLPDDDIYTNMNMPSYPVIPPCAQNDGYLGDFHYYDPKPKNDIRWDETKLDAGNIQPSFLFPHRPYGPYMGL